MVSITEKGRVLSVNVSPYRGVKYPVAEIELIKGFGVKGDYHAGTERQVSLFSIEYLRESPIPPSELRGFVENITIDGISSAKVGDIFKVGNAVIKIKFVGKDKKHSSGRPYMVSRYGWFGDVLRGGMVRVGDEIRKLRSLKIGVIVASDKASAGEREDLSGKVIEEKIMEIGGEVGCYAIVPDDIELIVSKIKEFIEKDCDIVFTSGGTGWSERDVTPEATLRVIERFVPGLSEIMRVEGFRKTPFAILSRGVAGIVGNTLVVNLPGSPKGVSESLDIIMPALLHGIGVLKGWEKECGKKA